MSRKMRLLEVKKQIEVAIEQILNARLQKKSAAIIESAAKSYLISLGHSMFETERYSCLVVEQPYKRLDVDRLKQYLGDELEGFYVQDTKTIFQITQRK